MRINGRIGAMAVIGLGVSIVAACAGEEKIPLDAVPKPVMKAFKAKFPEATIKNAIKEDAEGKITYEIESKSKSGLAIDAVLKPDGEFVAIEKEMKADDLPEAVTAAIKAKYPKSKVEKAEELIQGEKSSLEVAIKTADGKGVELVLDKDGKILKTSAAE